MIAFFTPGPWEMAVIGLVALLIFGKRLPGIIGNMGKGIKEFRKGLRE